MLQKMLNPRSLAFLAIGLLTAIFGGQLLLKGSGATADNPACIQSIPDISQTGRTLEAAKQSETNLAQVQADLLQASRNNKASHSATTAQAVQTLAAQRAKLLGEVMQTNPSAALDNLLSAQDTTDIRPDAAGCAESPATISGRLEMMHQDAASDNAVNEMKYTLVQASGQRVNLHIARKIGLKLTSGLKLKATGHLLGNHLLVDGQDKTTLQPVQNLSWIDWAGSLLAAPAHAAVVSDSTGPQHTIVVMINFSDTPQPTWTQASAKSELIDGPNNYYQEDSYGQTSFNGDVAGWYNTTLAKTCDYNAIQTAAINAADPTTDFTQYGRLVILMPDNGCWWGGLGSVGKWDVTTADGTLPMSIAWIRDGLTQDIYHELGHNMNLNHAQILDCGNVSWASDYCSDSQGDPYTGGGGSNLVQHNAFQKDAAGWFSPAAMPTVTTSSQYNLDPYETISSGIKALKIPRSSNTPNDYLYVEYRSPIGYDNNLNNSAPGSNVFQGAILHITDPIDVSNSALLSPNPPIKPLQMALLPGQSFTDPSTGTMVTIGALGATLPVTVTIGANTDHTPPTAAITAPANNATVSGTVPVTSAVTDNGSISRVELYLDDTLKTTLTTAPYTYSWDTTTTFPGTIHTLYTKAYDSANNVTKSAPLTVTVTNQPHPFYLSDLPFVGTPTNGWGPVERDMANGGFGTNDGPPLKIRGTTYAKGLGANAATEIHYNLAAQCSSFTSTVGIDDSTGGGGSVIFQVYLDGAKLYDSGLMTGTTAAKNFNLPMTAGNDLKLVVTDGGDNSYSDSADWANPIVTCGRDTIAPTTSITSPANNSKLPLFGGNVTVTAAASDNVGVTKVDIIIDNVVKATKTAPPYTYSWNTSSVPFNSTHTITAKAYDAAGNIGTAPTITVKK